MPSLSVVRLFVFAHTPDSFSQGLVRRSYPSTPAPRQQAAAVLVASDRAIAGSLGQWRKGTRASVRAHTKRQQETLLCQIGGGARRGGAAVCTTLSPAAHFMVACQKDGKSAYEYPLNKTRSVCCMLLVPLAREVLAILPLSFVSFISMLSGS